MQVKTPDVITVVITTWQVPFDQVVQGIYTFANTNDATKFINEQSAKWFRECRGNDSIAQLGNNEIFPYENPFGELGYNAAHFHLWGGENGFHAMLDAASAARLNEAYYKREYDDKGLKRPGYMRVAMGEDVSADIAELQQFCKPRN